MNLIYNYTCHALVDSTIKSLKLSSYLFDRCKTALIRFFKVYFLDPQSISLAEVETDILEGNQFEINIYHNLK